MISIPPSLMLIAVKHGGKALAILVLILALVAGYFYWKHEVSSGAYESAMQKCNESKEKFRIDAELFKLAKQEEVNKLNKKQSERVENAIQTYINHYESIRNTPIATSLRIKTSSASSGCDTLPGTNQNRSKTEAGTSRTGEAELPRENLQQLNTVISDIENLQLKCERLLNSMP